MHMKKIIIDLDNTLTIHEPEKNSYENMKPNIKVIEKLAQYSEKGYGITIFTARGMKTYQENLKAITMERLPIILKWLDVHKVPYDEVRIGKPFCGEQGFYVDDKAVRPSEFISLSESELQALVS